MRGVADKPFLPLPRAFRRLQDLLCKQPDQDQKRPRERQKDHALHHQKALEKLQVCTVIDHRDADHAAGAVHPKAKVFFLNACDRPLALENAVDQRAPRLPLFLLGIVAVQADQPVLRSQRRCLQVNRRLFQFEEVRRKARPADRPSDALSGAGPIVEAEPARRLLGLCRLCKQFVQRVLDAVIRIAQKPGPGEQKDDLQNDADQ